MNAKTIVQMVIAGLLVKFILDRMKRPAPGGTVTTGSAWQDPLTLEWHLFP